MARGVATPTDSAVAQLQDQIETIRREAYDEGYRAAMQVITEFAAGTVKPTPATASGRPRRQRSPATTAVKRVAAGKSSRGDNARHVAEALTTLPERTGPAAAIRKALAGRGISMAYTSIRHALGQLQTRGEASVAEDGKTWSYTAS